jgi:hypothetical protein
LGRCYLCGEGVQKDDVEAVKLFRKAVDQGYVGALEDLGGCYYSGSGVEKDLVEAYKWYLLAGQFTSHYDHSEEWVNFMKEQKSKLSWLQIIKAKRRANEWHVQHKLTTTKSAIH